MRLKIERGGRDIYKKFKVLRFKKHAIVHVINLKMEILTLWICIFTRGLICVQGQQLFLFYFKHTARKIPLLPQKRSYLHHDQNPSLQKR